MPPVAHGHEPRVDDMAPLFGLPAEPALQIQAAKQEARLAAAAQGLVQHVDGAEQLLVHRRPRVRVVEIAETREPLRMAPAQRAHLLPQVPLLARGHSRTAEQRVCQIAQLFRLEGWLAVPSAAHLLYAAMAVRARFHVAAHPLVELAEP